MSENHWIYRIKNDLTRANRLAQELEAQLKELKNYVYSSKFDNNPYVHKNDIALRIEQGIDYAYEITNSLD